MHVFVTGGSGFVGGHVIEGLIACGHEVVAMARSERAARAVEAFGATPVRCALGSVRSEHLDRVDAVVHAAAYVEEWGPRERFWEINVDGTQQLLDAARTAGVGRFVFVGTEAAVFDGGDLVDVDETHPYPERQRFPYSETKAEAERRVLAASDDAMTALSVRPRLVWGPRDASVLPAIRRMVDDGGWMWLDGGRPETSTCHVYNLVHAIALALTKGRGGRAYFVADDERSTLRDFLTELAATDGYALRDRNIPGSIARAAAALVETAWRLLRRSSTPPITRFATAMMSSTITVRTARARQELGYEPVITVAEGMQALREEPPLRAAA